MGWMELGKALVLITVTYQLKMRFWSQLCVLSSSLTPCTVGVLKAMSDFVPSNCCLWTWRVWNIDNIIFPFTYICYSAKCHRTYLWFWILFLTFVFVSSGFVRCVGGKDKCVTLLPPPNCEMENAAVSPRPLLFSLLPSKCLTILKMTSGWSQNLLHEVIKQLWTKEINILGKLINSEVLLGNYLWFCNSSSMEMIDLVLIL